ncbi:MAG: hypothetical protein ACYDCL_09335 [Myxococcales bacterium]
MTAGVLHEVGDGLFQVEKVLPSGWCMSMTLVRLPGGGLVVYSPLFVDAGTFDQVERLGRPAVLVAPNHFHHLSLPRFVERYPEALAIATEVALPRLRRKGHGSLRPHGEAAARLPADVRLLPCEGLASGELWLSLGDGVARTLVVADAFFHVNRKVTGVTATALRLLDVVPGLKVSRTFRLLALGDAGSYRAFVRAALERERPTRLVVSHGEPIAGDDLAGRLAASMEVIR